MHAYIKKFLSGPWVSVEVRVDKKYIVPLSGVSAELYGHYYFRAQPKADPRQTTGGLAPPVRAPRLSARRAGAETQQDWRRGCISTDSRQAVTWIRKSCCSFADDLHE
jgi:hypothetical protein